jgi:hypothetical protein
MQVCAVRKSCEQLHPEAALGQPSFDLGTVLWHPLFRADTAHATESSTKLVIHDKTGPLPAEYPSTILEK